LPARPAAFAALLPLFAQSDERPAPGTLSITALDVGQGAAILVETPAGRLLFDTGPRYGGDSEAGARVLVPFLRARGIGRLEAHYFRHLGFFEPDQLIRNIGRIRHLPAVIVQGRYDVICPPATAWRLYQAWPQARFHVVEDAGHAAFEPGSESALVAATTQFRDQQNFRPADHGRA
jgi:pimeloyl-ACP methyl ester carboxylesterase